MTPPTPRLRTIPLPFVLDNAPAYSPVLPSPPMSSTVDLNPVLRPSSPRKLYYDITLPPHTVVFDEFSTSYTLCTPATTPPMTCFRIIPPTTPAWQVMAINSHGVTVFDVLDAIYHSLHTPVSPSSWDDLDLPRVVVTPPATLRSRSHDLPRTPPSTPKSDGSRRVDHLHGRTWFFGLEKCPYGPEYWFLRTTG